MGKRIAGTCYFKVDGEQLEISGSVEMPMSDKKRESVMSASGPVGYKETTVVPYFKGTFFLTEEFPLDGITEGTDLTITVELANGRAYTLSGAYLAGDAPVKTEDGTVDLEFFGDKGQWQ